jgi:hypothetical protein
MTTGMVQQRLRFRAGFVADKRARAYAAMGLAWRLHEKSWRMQEKNFHLQ